MAACALLTSGCAALGLAREGPEDGDQRLAMAAALVEAGSYDRAERLLRLLASRCENGEDGRTGLLLLTSLLLDPRNPGAAPDSAALMAARFLKLPEAPPPERPVAESLYVLALELGADPGLRPDAQADRGIVADRFSRCDEPLPTDQPLALPVLEHEPLARALVRLRQQRDSLAAALPAGVEAGTGGDGLRARNRVLEGRVAELEAELERIQRLLGGRDTTSLEPRPR
jgi:hypothetical protein